MTTCPNCAEARLEGRREVLDAIEKEMWEQKKEHPRIDVAAMMFRLRQLRPSKEKEAGK